jgi:Chromo (CHRromatin Organisation MOdifier) domain
LFDVNIDEELLRDKLEEVSEAEWQTLYHSYPVIGQPIEISKRRLGDEASYRLSTIEVCDKCRNSRLDKTYTQPEIFVYEPLAEVGDESLAMEVDEPETISTTEVTKQTPAPKKAESDSEPIYEVEKVLGHRQADGSTLFKVRWKGFGEGFNKLTAEEDTWEPLESFDVMDCVIKYMVNTKASAVTEEHPSLETGTCLITEIGDTPMPEAIFGEVPLSNLLPVQRDEEPTSEIQEISAFMSANNQFENSTYGLLDRPMTEDYTEFFGESIQSSSKFPDDHSQQWCE